MTTDKGLVERGADIVAWLHTPTGGVLTDADKRTVVPKIEARFGSSVEKDFEPLVRAARIRELEAAAERRAYTYIGKDGKPVLARDLEDQRDAAEARCRKLEEALGEIVAVADAIEAPLVIREGLPPYAELKTRGRGALTAARALLDQADGEEQ